MPLVVKAKKNDTTGDVIKKFKKIVAIAQVLEIAKNREFHFKPSAVKNIKMNEKKRQKRRIKMIQRAGAKGMK
jgi:ribosomal protein S21